MAMEGVPTRLLSVCGALIVLWLIWMDVKKDAVEFLVGTNFGNNGLDQLTVPLGLRVHKGTRLESKSYANPVPRNGLPCRRDNVDV